MWGWVIVGLLVAAFVGWIAFRWYVYRRLFADRNFLEVATGVARLKVAALDKVIVSHEDEVKSPADPRALVTSAGLVLIYTVWRVEDRFVHHYSVSVDGGITAHAIGETFVLFVAKLLGVPFEKLALGVGQTTVHHAQFDLSISEQTQFAEFPVPEVSKAGVKAFLTEGMEARKHLQWQRSDAGPA